MCVVFSDDIPVFNMINSVLTLVSRAKDFLRLSKNSIM